ncbi:MAG: lipid II flippase MurJ, partial [Planctomycetota bacterium]
GWAWLGEDPAAVRELTVRVMPFVVLVCLAALATGALHVRGRFAAPALAPAAMNVAWIATLVGIGFAFGWTGPSPSELGEAGDVGASRHMSMARVLAWGVLAAGALQLVVQWPALRAAGFLGGPREAAPLDPRAPRPVDVLKRAAPLALGAAVYQINVMVDGLMAEGLLRDGGPTIHYFANRVQQFPLALVAMAATSAVFPALQQLGHRGERGALRRLHDRTHLAVAAVALPAAVGLFALSEPVVEVSFERGAFGREGVERTTLALQVLCFAILPAGATGLVARTYYALGDFATPVKISAAMLALNVVLNLLLLMGFGLDVEGLAAATVTTSVLNVALLVPGLTRRLGLPRTEVAFVPLLSRILAASVLCGLAARGAEGALDDVVGRTAALGAAIAAGGAVYVGSAIAFGVDDVRLLVRRVRAKLFGNRV